MPGKQPSQTVAGSAVGTRGHTPMRLTRCESGRRYTATVQGHHVEILRSQFQGTWQRKRWQWDVHIGGAYAFSENTLSDVRAALTAREAHS